MPNFVTYVPATGVPVRREIPIDTEFSERARLGMVGDARTAYITYGDTVLAKDIQTWDTKWTASGVPIMPLINGGLAFMASGTGIMVSNDGEGTAIGTGTPMPLVEPVCSLSSVECFGIGATGLTAYRIVPSAATDMAFFQAPTETKQQRPRTNTLITLVANLISTPEDADPYTSAMLRQDVELNMRLVRPPGIRSEAPVETSVSAARFLDEMSRRHRAIAYIGHAIRDTSDILPNTVPPNTSYGFSFYDKDLVPEHLPETWPERPIGGNLIVPGGRIVSDIPIVFIASCRMGETMRVFLDMDATPSRRAFIVPKNAYQQTDLKFSALAWEIITRRLALDDSVYEAVEAANDFLRQRTPPDENEQHLEFEVIGADGGRNIGIMGPIQPEP